MLYSRLVTDMPSGIPKRAAYKAAEVCEIVHIQPYVLRSWESEFPKLGVVRAGTRIYRQADLEQVQRIKQLVFEEGLTLAGARRRIEEDGQPQPELPLEELVTPEIRQRIGRVKEGLQELLGLLGGQPAVAAPSNSRAAAGDGRAGASCAPGRTAPTPQKKATGSRAKAKGAGSARRHIGRA